MCFNWCTHRSQKLVRAWDDFKKTDGMKDERKDLWGEGWKSMIRREYQDNLLKSLLEIHYFRCFLKHMHT